MSEENQESFVEDTPAPLEPQPGYAILKNGIGCRTVASKDEISEDEIFSLTPQTGYAVRNDGMGWRCVASADDVAYYETFSLEQPAPPVPTDTWLSSPAGIAFQIKTLETSITPRRIREAVLGIDPSWLATIEDQIEDLRAQLS